MYSAPAALPNPNSVTVTAASTSDSSITGSVIVDVLNPIPSLSGIQPSSINTGAFSLTVNGSNFVSGSQVMLAGNALTTSFVSTTQLTATGNAPTAGTFAVSVTNPDPGSASSGTVNLQVNGAVNSSACSGISLGQGGSLNGFLPFPAGNAWNTDISGAAGRSKFRMPSLISSARASPCIRISARANIKAAPSAFRTWSWAAAKPFVPIDFTAYGDESDPGPMPVPSSAPIEGYPNPGSGDRHVLVLDNSNCWLYELYSSYPNNDGSWNAASAAVWDLLNYNHRPYTWTSADAAGLSIFAGLVRYDEVAAGEIKHAIRVTFSQSQRCVCAACHALGSEFVQMQMRRRWA